MRTSLRSLGLFALGAYAQTSSSYTDSNTGITFQGYEDTSGTGFFFGMALPETIGSDFIGQIVMETNGTGYAGVSLTGEMVGSLLIVAWPNDDSVISSFRETSGYTNPEVYSDANLTLSSISNGTFVNSTHMSYTFLCGGCITGDSYSFEATATDAVIGWAVGDGAVTNPSSSSSAVFTFHGAGYGEFGLAMADAQSSDYSTWASMATVSNSSTSSTSSNSTCSSTSTNTTATVSNSTYDYIIAGAGPAGIIVAERLAESGKSVLLLERGSDSYYFTGGRSTLSWNDTVTQYDVPSMSYYLTTASDTSEYCTDTASMAGCILGGSTMVNALMFVPPQEADFNDKWPTGWKWDDVSAAAERLYERNPGTTLASKDGKRYDQGAYDVLSTFFDSLGWSHVDAIESPNEKTQVYSYPPWDIQDGLRGGPVRSYYPLAQAMSNFKLTLETQVIRAVRNGSTISGVEVEDSTGARQIINVNSNGKVILAAGSMSSPRILFNSGIGPTEQITTVKNGCTDVTLPDEADWIDLPVGENLRDHPIFTLTFNTTVSNASYSSLLASAFTNPNTSYVDMFAQGSGPLVQSGQRLNFWTSMNTTNGTKYFQGTCNSPAAGQVRIKLYLTHGLTSTGVLGITSDGATEFTTNPWLNTDEDKAAATQMIDYLLNAAKNSSILSYSDSTATGASLISSYITGDHFVGTAQMSATNDGTGVVDTNTKVWGTDNLYVVDASIHPDLPTGNTQAIIMVAAEKAAEKIMGTNSTSSATSSSSSGNYTLPASVAVAKASKSCGGHLSSFAPTSFITAAKAAATDASSPTTLTVLATSVETIYSCAATVTNCPARSSAVGSATVAVVTTHTVTVATTTVAASDAAAATSEAISKASATGATGIAAIVYPSTASSAVSLADAVSATQPALTAQPTSAASLVDAASATEAGTTTLTVLATSVETIYSCAATVTNCPARSSAVGSATVAVVTTHTITVATTTVAASDAAAATSEAISKASATGATGIAAITASSSVDAVSAAATQTGSTTLTVLATSARTTVSDSQTVVVTDTITIATTVCPVTEAEAATSKAIASASATGATGIGAITTAVSSADAVAATQTGSTTLTVLATSARTTVSDSKTVVVTDTITIATTVCPVTEAEAATSKAIASASATGATGIGAIAVVTSTTTAVITPTITAAASSADAVAATKTGSTTLTVSAAQVKTTVSAGATVIVTETIVVATTVCPVTEAEAASSKAIASASATGATGLQVIQAAATTTAAAAITIPTGISALVTGVAGNASSGSVDPMPAGTTLKDILTWLYEYLENLTSS